MQNAQPYTGLQQKLVLAFDVGTTFSGTSYCLLEPGEIPVLRRVTRYPAQEQVGGDAKIPTILYYDELGNVRAAGAEALSDNIQHEAEENDWIKAEWFKLHLRPRTRTAAHVTEAIPPLPEGKTAVQVFADFLKYLHSCAQRYIEETHATGVDLWRNVQANTEVVLTHPNGWEGGQQALMREAAIIAGVIPDTDDGRSRLFFVTEGEASLHFCIQSGLLKQNSYDKGILVVDAGGGTVDINAYRRTSPDVQSYAEITPSQCAFKGSVFVTRNARAYLEQLLKGSRFEADIPQIANTFDKRTKLTFASPTDSYYIRFGRLNDNAPELNIRAGQLKLSGHDMAQFFEPSVSAIHNIVKDICNAPVVEISTIFLVGGFGASNWLYSNLKDAFATRDVCRPDNQTNKAVADGAVSYHIDHLVSNRIARYSYGVGATFPYNASNPEHTARPDLVYTEIDGSQCIAGYFSTILSKSTSITETQEFRERFWIEDRDQHSSALNKVKTPVTCFRGQRNDPRWFDEESNLYSTLCYVEADLSHLPKSSTHSAYIGATYYQVNFDVVLSLGLTEFKAYIAWRENGIERRSLAQLVYDPDVLIDDIAPMI